MKKIATFAFAAALATVVSVNAFAGTFTETSDTWKPGFSLDDSGAGRYTRTVHVDADTGYNSTLQKVIETQVSSVPQEGFEAVGGNRFERQVIIVNKGVSSPINMSDTRNTWQPGYYNDDNGLYARF
jgi:hypothetical protein